MEICGWCRDPDSAIRSKGLCGHCYRIKRQIATLRDELSALERQRELDGMPYIERRFRLENAENKKWLAECDGAKYGDIGSRPVDGLELEHELSFLSERLVGKKLYSGVQNSLNRRFSPTQRQYLFYLLSRMSRAWNRKKRGSDAFLRSIDSHQ